MKKINDQISIPICIFVLFSALAGAYFTFFLFKEKFITIEHRNLTNLSQSRTSSIKDYINYLTEIKYLRSEVINSGFFSTKNDNSKNLSIDKLVDNLDTHNDFNKMFLINTEKEEIVFAIDFIPNNTRSSITGKLSSVTGFDYEELFKNGNISPIVNNSDKKDKLYINIPLTNTKYDKYSIVMDVNMDKINKILLSSPGLSETEETYIIDKNNIMRSPSIFNSNNQIIVNTTQANNCINNKGIDMNYYNDYRMVPVYGQYSIFKIGNYDYCLLAEIDVAELYDPLYYNIRLILASFIVLVLLIVLFISITVRRKLLPLQELTKIAESIKDGELSKDIQITNTNNELELLSISIKRMVDRLRQEDFKHQLISKVSHELRTPLTVARGYLELVTNNKKERITKKSMYYLVKVDEQMKYLIKFINDILDLNKIQSGKIEFKKDKINIKDLLKDIEEYSNILFIKKNIKLIINNTDNKLFIVADYDKVKQAIINILSNSYKYTPENGKVNIYVDKLLDKINIIIEDNGKGISAEKLETVFNEYSTKEGGETDMQSTGLGLPITKELLYKMNGDIKIDSEVNIGTTVIISLPTK
ncbi:MAG: HAMP domain-containing sensor histidine kinase [Cyanobium sp. MAG06]|nr:HAMP domain-containing sensor histidine kinase [Cyanobium sp. MAG06]